VFVLLPYSATYVAWDCWALYIYIYIYTELGFKWTPTNTTRHKRNGCRNFGFSKCEGRRWHLVMVITFHGSLCGLGKKKVKLSLCLTN
jgi:hypothetical protein